MAHFSAGSQIVSETIHEVWSLSGPKLHSFAKVQGRMRLTAPHILVASWNGFVSLAPSRPPSLSPSPPFSPPPIFCLSALSSVQLFTFSKVIHFQDNLIMSNPTLLCFVTHQDGPEKEGGNSLNWLCLALFTWWADESYSREHGNHLVSLSQTTPFYSFTLPHNTAL